MAAVAIIPARGGSKRIPGKNIKDFAGQPIIAYSINAARKSGCFNRIIVSTDSTEIASVAEEIGAEVPFVRPPELADDFTGTQDVVCHAVQWLQDRDQHVDMVCCIYATAPFVRADDLRKGLDLLRSSGKSFAFSVTTFPFPVHRSIRLLHDGTVEPMFSEAILSRSQDLEEAYHDAGQFYWGRAKAFIDRVPLFSGSSLGVVLPRHRVQDIDTPEDWRRAELMFRALQGEEDAPAP